MIISAVDGMGGIAGIGRPRGNMVDDVVDVEWFVVGAWRGLGKGKAVESVVCVCGQKVVLSKKTRTALGNLP